MARIDADEAANEKLTRVYVALTLADAKSAEDELTRRGVDYVVTVEGLGRTLFGSPRNVAVFAVPDVQAVYCSSVLTDAGFGKGLITG